MPNKNIIEVSIADLAMSLDDNPRIDYASLPDLQESIKANGFDPSFPIQVLREPKGSEKKYRVIGGFTRFQASQNIGLEKVPVSVCDYTPEQVILNHVLSNSGTPLTQMEQGKVYARLRNYGTDPATLAVGEVVREKPASLEEIASKVGKSPEHVRTCILIAESPSWIVKLYDDGKISANAIIEASKVTKDDKLQRKLIEAAINNANGKTATDKHVKAVKEVVIPVAFKKSEKAGKAQDNQISDSDSSVGDSTNIPAKTRDIEQGDSGEKSDAHNASASTGDNANSEDGATPSAVTPSESTTGKTWEPEDSGSTEDQPALIESNTAKHDEYTVIINRVCKERALIMSDDDVEYMVKALTGGPF